MNKWQQPIPLQQKPRSDALPVLALIGSMLLFVWAIFQTQPTITPPLPQRDQATYVPAVGQAETIVANQDSRNIAAITTSVARTPTYTPWPTRTPFANVTPLAPCYAEVAGRKCALVPTLIPPQTVTPTVVPLCTNPPAQPAYVWENGRKVCIVPEKWGSK